MEDDVECVKVREGEKKQMINLFDYRKLIQIQYNQ